MATLQSEAAGTGTGTGTAQSPELTHLQAERSQAVSNQKSAYNAWQCQLYGPCRPPGNGPLARADQARYATFGQQVSQLTAKITQLQNQQQAADKKQQGLVSATASSQLTRARKAVNRDIAEQQHETTDFITKVKGDTGLLIRLQALGAVTAGNSTLNAARWLLFLLFVVIDCMPVFIKVMMNLGPEGNYDKMLAAEEAKQLRVAASNRAVRQSAEIIDASAFMDEPRSRIAGWTAELPSVTEQVIAYPGTGRAGKTECLGGRPDAPDKQRVDHPARRARGRSELAADEFAMVAEHRRPGGGSPGCPACAGHSSCCAAVRMGRNRTGNRAQQQFRGTA